MCTWGFTGSRIVDITHDEFITRVFLHLALEPTCVVTGAANGIDTLAAFWFWRRFGTLIRHHIVVPAGTHNRDLVHFFAQLQRAHGKGVVCVEHMPPHTTHKHRNQRIVNLSHRVVGLPLLRPTRQPRSGTWQTIRMADRAGKLDAVWLLDEGVRWVTP